MTSRPSPKSNNNQQSQISTPAKTSPSYSLILKSSPSSSISLAPSSSASSSPPTASSPSPSLHKNRSASTADKMFLRPTLSTLPFVFLALFLISSSPSPSNARIWNIPMPSSLQSCYNQVAKANISTYVGSTFSWFCETAIRGSQTGPKKFDAQKTSYYEHLYKKSIEVIRTSAGSRKIRAKRQAGQQRCLRREYRTLSDVERSRFHNAINALKSDTSVDPNKYDAIALLHTGMASFTAHGGPGFPGWHRIYTLMFESALREVDPGVCLPYWDSTLDSELDDPLESVVWSPRFFGNPQGPVEEGPFAGWVTPEGSQLMRTASADGELFRRESIEDILTRNSHADILTSEDTDPRYDLEFHHAAVHVFCGGTMGQLDTSAFDPIFFIHHSYVDYVWETFRNKLRRQGIDPNIYPDVEDIESRHHGASATGFGELTQADGYSDQLIESYEYEAVPRCSSMFPDCRSRYLTCYTDIGRCIPIQQDDLNDIVVTRRPTLPPRPRTPPPQPRQQQPHPRQQLPHQRPSSTPVIHQPFPGQTRTRSPARDTCSSGHAKSKPIQNSFCCDQSCDTNKWAYVPVKIVSVRPPNFRSFQSFPVKNGYVDTSDDIYSPSAYKKTNRYISRRQGNPKTFQRCQGDSSAGQIFLSSKGINYSGYYKEATIVDQRLAVSISMGYVAVKRPSPGSGGVTQALLRAHDSCGRVCHPACRDPQTNQFMPCSGAVAISSDSPKMYGDTFDDAVLDVFDYDFNDDCPRFNTDNFYVTFYCDYHNDFPYVTSHNNHQQQRPQQRKQQPPKLPPQVVRKTRLPSRGDAFDSRSEVCRLGASCTVGIPCASEYRQCDLYNDLQLCVGSCRTFAQCSYGRYFIRLCPRGQYFDDLLKECVTGLCRKTADGKRVISPGAQTSGRGSGSNRLQYLSDDIGVSGKISPSVKTPLVPLSGRGGSGSYQQQMEDRLRKSRQGDRDRDRESAIIKSQASIRSSNPRTYDQHEHSHDHGTSSGRLGNEGPRTGLSYADMISGFMRNMGQRVASRYKN